MESGNGTTRKIIKNEKNDKKYFILLKVKADTLGNSLSLPCTLLVHTLLVHYLFTVAVVHGAGRSHLTPPAAATRAKAMEAEETEG